MITKQEFKDQFVLSKSVFNISVQSNQRNRFTLALFVMTLLPILVQLIIYFYRVYDNSWSFIQISPRELEQGDFYRVMLRVQLNAAFPYLYTMVALIVGTNMYREEINEDTISYIMTKPIRRDFIFLQKYLAYLYLSIRISLPSLLLSYSLAVISSLIFDSGFTYGITGINIFLYLAYSLYNMIVLVIGLIMLLSALCIAFLTTGMLLERPLLINLFLGFGILIEQILIDLIDNRIEPLYLATNFIVRLLAGFDQAFPGFLGNREIYQFNEVGSIINWLLIVTTVLYIGMRKAMTREFS